MLALSEDGACHLPELIKGQTGHWMEMLAPHFERPEPGVRLAGQPKLVSAISTLLAQPQLAPLLGERGWRCVRAIAFDKKPSSNWALGWHQDRTIAVRQRIEVAGFGPWSVKRGIHHVEPPFAIIKAMRTLRIHFDPVDETNGALLVATGSHLLGKIPTSDTARVALTLPTHSCHAAQGDGWLYATAVLHASKRSVGTARRRVLQLDFAPVELPKPLEWSGL